MQIFVGVTCTEFYPNRIISVENRAEFDAAVWLVAFTTPRAMAYVLTQQHLLRRVVPRLIYKYLTHGENSIYILKWNTLVTEPILRKLRTLGNFFNYSYSEFHKNPASSLDVGTSWQPDGHDFLEIHTERLKDCWINWLQSASQSHLLWLDLMDKRNCKRILNMSVLRADCCWFMTKNNIFKTAILHYPTCLSCVPFCTLITVGWRIQSRCLYCNVAPLGTLCFLYVLKDHVYAIVLDCQLLNTLRTIINEKIV